jgi:hypothetical protein
MERSARLTLADAAGMLANVQEVRRTLRARYFRTLFGGAWFISLFLGLATFGSLGVMRAFGTRTMDGGQAAFGAYWAAAGLVTILGVRRRNRREPVSGRAEVHLLATCAVFVLGFAAVFFAPLAHNHIYLSPALFASAYLLMAAVERRVGLAGLGLVLGAGLGLGSSSDALGDGYSWPVAIYAASFLFAGAVSWLVERRFR